MTDATDDLKAILPADYQHLSIDEKNPRFVEAKAAAKAAGLTQQQFTALLGFEAKAVVARQGAVKPATSAAAAAPPPAPAKPEPIPGYEKMSFAERLMAGEARKKANGGR
jgi:hypothetical protein